MAQVCKSTESAIAAFLAEKKQSSWKIIVVAMIGSVLSSLLSVWFVLPKPTLSLTSEQMTYLQEGQMLMQIWPKLTKKEKDRLKSVSYEVMQSK
jgi:membrane protein YqaA with SNARE-associated domain